MTSLYDGLQKLILRASRGMALLKGSVFYYLLFLVLLVLVIYPLITLFAASFFTGQPGAFGKFTLKAYEELFLAGGLKQIAVNTFIYVLARTSLCLCLALLFAWAVARTDVPCRGFMEIMISLPYFIPDLLSAISWIMLANPQNGLINQLATAVTGKSGYIVNIYSWGGLIFHSTLHDTAFMFLMLVGFFKNMDPSFEEAAVTLGAGKYKTALSITMPMLSPAIMGITALSLIRSLEAFIDPLLFGNPAGIYVFSNQIYRVLRNRFPPDYQAATALSMLLVLFTVTLVLVQWKIVGARQFTTVSGKGHQPRLIRLPKPVRWSILGLGIIYGILAFVAPIAQLILGSFFKIFGLYRWDHLTFANWITVINDKSILIGLRNTIVYSAVAACGVIVLGGLVGYVRVRSRHWLGKVMELAAWAPWTAPGIVMGLALLWSWLLLPPPFNLYGTSLIVILGFIVKGLPLGTRMMQSAIMQLTPDLEESSRVQGGSWLYTTGHILLPLLRMNITAVFVVVFALSARDLTIPLLLCSPGTETLTIALITYFEQGLRNIVAVVAVIQLMLVLCLICLERLTRPKILVEPL